MKSLMMKMPMVTTGLLAHSARHHRGTEIVSRRTEGDVHRYTYWDCLVRTRRLASSLEGLGVRRGDRLATIAWNGYRHMELYYAIGGVGAVVHTINPRLSVDQVAWILNHAGSRLLFVDRSFLSLAESVAARCPAVEKTVLMVEDDAAMPAAWPGELCNYERLLQAGGENFRWPALEEDDAVGLCYTSGTTGDPKGVLYSHRSTVLHSMACALPDAMNLGSGDTVMPVVPMFHVNAWGIPYTAALIGAKLVLPGSALDPHSLFELLESERVTCALGVPTVWMGLLQYVQENQRRFRFLRSVLVGGAACPPNLIEAFQEQHGVKVLHGWGMTEMSPLGTIASLRPNHEWLTPAAKRQMVERQGKAFYGVDIDLVDDQGQAVPWDASSSGHLRARGHWVAGAYFGADSNDCLERDAEGLEWFPTGDIAVIDAQGSLRITDRNKDLIKSGGEWISSMELESIALRHSSVLMAAAIGVPDDRWGERPVLIVVGRTNEPVSAEAILTSFEGQVPSWSRPDAVYVVDALPIGATGKVVKTRLREQVATLPYTQRAVRHSEGEGEHIGGHGRLGRTAMPRTVATEGVR
jgi:3-(methylthio)propionyl---CoA ligase